MNVCAFHRHWDGHQPPIKEQQNQWLRRSWFKKLTRVFRDFGIEGMKGWSLKVFRFEEPAADVFDGDLLCRWRRARRECRGCRGRDAAPGREAATAGKLAMGSMSTSASCSSAPIAALVRRLRLQVAVSLKLSREGDEEERRWRPSFTVAYLTDSALLNRFRWRGKVRSSDRFRWEVGRRRRQIDSALLNRRSQSEVLQSTGGGEVGLFTEEWRDTQFWFPNLDPQFPEEEIIPRCFLSGGRLLIYPFFHIISVKFI